VSIRGSWGRRSYKVLLLEDGSYIAPAPYLGPGAYYNPPSDRIEAIRVIKGAETLLYGPNNMFGVVDYVTRRPPGKPEAMFKLSGGQRAYTTAQAGYGGTWNQLGTDVQVVYKRFDGFLANSETSLFNLHTKFYFELDEHQSFYFKLGYQREKNNASLAAQTPFTFEADPLQNPFDADEFTSRRYALDVIHKYARGKHATGRNWSLTSKVYGADFARDWWRQKTALIPASDVLAYVGEDRYRDRYAYLDGLDVDADDYVRVGRVINDREATTDSKWNYTFAGLQEQFEHRWQRGNWRGESVAGARLHKEIYLDQFLENDSSRWARSGRYTTDLKYDLWSVSVWAKQALKHGRVTLTPIARFEYVDMIRQDLLAASRNPGLNPDNAPELEHAYPVFLPGFAVDVQLLSAGQASPNPLRDLHLFSSMYRGFIAPNSQFAFLVEENGLVTTPRPDDELNMKPELSMNGEVGLRGTLAQGRVSGQLAGFLSRIRNFYAAGQGEVFQSLGEVWIRGVEAGLDLELLPNA
jgi:Fe(3+) dicitrate transport protein